MAAKSKKRPSKIENKLLKLEKLQLKDVLCSICQSILIEPVTLPCQHNFCQGCFNGSVENNALCCPLCRLRIGSWLRTATKQKNLVNVELWNVIKSKFTREIDIKVKGEDVCIPEDKPQLRISQPGEIRSEYESEIKRLRAERLELEQKHLQETEILIRKLQNEEEEAHKKYLARLKEDELLAQQLQQQQAAEHTPKKRNQKPAAVKPRLKVTQIESFLTKVSQSQNSPLLTDDNTSNDSSTPKTSTKPSSRASPEIVPSYGKFLKSFLDKKIKNTSAVWNKENGENIKKPESVVVEKETEIEDKGKVKTKTVIQSLPVSLPYTGILQHKSNVADNRSKDTSSVDSMRLELCYFKPIDGTTPTGFRTGKSLPLRVPGVRAVSGEATPPSAVAPPPAPSRAQYVASLCRLRNLSLAHNLPSAFVIALNMLRVKKECPTKCETSTKPKVKKISSTGMSTTVTQQSKRNIPNRNKRPGPPVGDKPDSRVTLRRTRSMGSITKEENETTPKKSKPKSRKACSERKPHLRSDSKKSSAKKEAGSPISPPETLNNNNKVKLAVKNLSSPLKNCDVKKILEEQLRIEKLIEQEQSDLELARRVEAEWNTRARAAKRSLALHVPRPAKKVKV